MIEWEPPDQGADVMKRTSRTLSAAVLALCVLHPGTSLAQEPGEYLVANGNQQLHLLAKPELGYVVKSPTNTSAAVLLDSTLDGFQSGDAAYLTVSGRPDTVIVLDQQPLSQNERRIGMLSYLYDTEYVSPLFSLDGDTVAVIPEIIVRLRQEADCARLEDLCREADCTITRNLLYTKLEFLISPHSTRCRGSPGNC